MTFAQLLTELAQNGIALTVTPDHIKLNVPVTQLPDHLRETLQLNKMDIIAIFTKPMKQADLIDTAVMLGGVVVGKVEEAPGKPVTVVYDDGTIAIMGPDDEIPF